MAIAAPIKACAVAVIKDTYQYIKFRQEGLATVKENSVRFYLVEGSAFLKVLRIGPFRNLWLSQAISQIFLNLLMFSLIIQVYVLTRSNTAVSLVIVTTVIPNIFFGAIAGVLVDRWNRKIVMFFSHFLRVLAVATFIISSESLVWIYLMTIIIGLITQFFMPAEGASIPEVVKDKNLLLTANSLFTLTFFSSVVLGNVLAGPFLQLFGSHLTFAMVAVAFLTASFFTAKLPGIEIREVIRNQWRDLLREKTWVVKIDHGQKGSLSSNFLEGLRHIKNTLKVRQAIFIMAIGQGTIAILGAIAPGFADKILHLTPANVSVIIMAPAALGMIAGAAIAGQYFARSKRENLIRFGFLGAAVALLIFSEIDHAAGLLGLPVIPIAILILLALGLANAFLEIPVNTLIQENTPLSIRSRVYGVISSVVGLAAILPVIIAGAVADTFGVRFVMFISAFVLLVMALYNIHRERQNQ